MRYPIRGDVAPSIDVTVYDAGTENPATIYAAESGGAPLAGGVVASDSMGRVVFWVDDLDYPMFSFFDIETENAESASGVWTAFSI